MHGNRNVVSDRAVGSVFVIVSTPSLQLFRGVRKAYGPMSVQAFRPELAGEHLDETVVGRLSRAGDEFTVAGQLCAAWQIEERGTLALGQIGVVHHVSFAFTEVIVYIRL